MRMLLPEVPGKPRRDVESLEVPTHSFSRQLEVPESGQPVHGGTYLIETCSPVSRGRTLSRTGGWRSPAASPCKCFLPCGNAQSRSGTPARDTTNTGSATAFSGTWPAVDVYEYGRLPSNQPLPETPAATPPPSKEREESAGARRTQAAVVRPHPEEAEATRPSAGREAEQPPARQTAETWQQQQPSSDASPTELRPILTRCIGFGDGQLPRASGRVYGGIEGAKDPRDWKKTMFRAESLEAHQPSGPKEFIDTLVPKTTVEERLKFVDLEFAQEVEKFVEVPEVYYNDVVVEVPQVVEVIKIVPREEVRENITYVPRFETKFIPKYVEVPVIKIVDRYEEVDEIHEVLKPVARKSVVERPQGKPKKVATTVHKKVLTQKPVPIISHQDVPVYKNRFEPKIIEEEFINQKPHFIDIPVPYEQSVIKHVDQPYFLNRYRDHLYPLPTGYHVTPVFRQGEHRQVVDVPLPTPYLVTNTEHCYRPPPVSYQVGAAHLQGYAVAGGFQHATFAQRAQQQIYQGAADYHQPSAWAAQTHGCHYTAPAASPSSCVPCPLSCPPMCGPQGHESDGSARVTPDRILTVNSLDVEKNYHHADDDDVGPLLKTAAP
ncbi:hypothetical protein Efla_007261 [Eimeria flavescens]